MPKKGPPEAVRISRRTETGSSPNRHWRRALCSESIGINSPPPRRRAPSTISPPATRLSLLARPRRLAASSAATDAGKPSDPTMPLITVTPAMAASATTASGPNDTLVPSALEQSSRSSPVGAATAT